MEIEARGPRTESKDPPTFRGLLVEEKPKGQRRSGQCFLLVAGNSGCCGILEAKGTKCFPGRESSVVSSATDGSSWMILRPEQ